jgi:hypothetical protein
MMERNQPVLLICACLKQNKRILGKEINNEEKTDHFAGHRGRSNSIAFISVLSGKAKNPS